MQATPNHNLANMDLLRESRSLLLYAGAGTLGTAIHFTVLFVALNFVAPVPASTLGAICGCITNYFLAQHFVFSECKPGRGTFVRFVAVAIFGIAVNAAIISTLIDLLPIALNQAVASGLVLVMGYSLNKSWSFGGR